MEFFKFLSRGQSHFLLQMLLQKVQIFLIHKKMMRRCIYIGVHHLEGGNGDEEGALLMDRDYRNDGDPHAGICSRQNYFCRLRLCLRVRPPGYANFVRRRT